MLALRVMRDRWADVDQTDYESLALKATATISVTLSLGDVNDLLAFVNEQKEQLMSALSAVWACVWYGVAVLRRPGGLLPHARAGGDGGAEAEPREP